MKEVLAIVVGGGPAPGINGVISAATIEAIEHGIEVIGIVGGINSLYAGDFSSVLKLNLQNVSGIDSSGGSILLTSRGMPGDPKKAFETMMHMLSKLNVRYLLTIGGEGTLYVANEIENAAKGNPSVIHVPKTIDDDLPLPAGLPTFGFETARSWGVGIAKNLKEDARTTRRWYFVQTMGRYTGHLALGIGKAADASVTLIPEEFPKKISFRTVADVLEGTILKRLSLGKEYGVAILAEGISGKFDPEELEEHGGHLEKDDLGRVKLSKIELSRFMAETVRKSLEERGIDVKIVPKDVGYELRAAPPVPFDAEYTQNLGFGAIKYLIQLKESGAMVIYYEGKIRSIPFGQMVNKKTGLIKIRYVDPRSETYQVARDYMFRLEREDFQSPKTLQRIARTARMPMSQFRKRFEPTLGV